MAEGFRVTFELEGWDESYVPLRGPFKLAGKPLLVDEARAALERFAPRVGVRAGRFGAAHV